MRLGELLVKAGLLTTEQVRQVLERQQQTGEPFGLLCERLAGVDPEQIEEAWATQYASLTRHVDPRVESYDDHALDLVTRRQAWQFRVLPIRFDANELLLATTRRHIRRALRFATNVIAVPVFPVLAEPLALGEAMCRRYPLRGMTVDSIEDDGLDRVLAIMNAAG